MVVEVVMVVVVVAVVMVVVVVVVAVVGGGRDGIRVGRVLPEFIQNFTFKDPISHQIADKMKQQSCFYRYN